MRYLLTALLLVPALVSAQELHTFKNGEVADADKLNESLQYILSNASGGCSAAQEGSNVRIKCADGSEGLLASGGTIVLLPESSTGEVPDITINSGEIVVMDANDVAIAKPYANQYYSGSYTVNFFPDESRRLGTISNDDEAQTVTVSCYDCGSLVYYKEENCSGIPFTGNSHLIHRLPDGKLYVVPQEGGVRGQFLFESRLQPEVEQCLNGEWLATAEILVEFIPAPEILNAAYPVRLEQLP